MNRDDMIKLAGKHAICTSDDHKEFLHDGLLAFAADLLASERAACAKLCMDKAYKMEREAVDAEKEGDGDTCDGNSATAWVLAVCSQEILARKDKP